MNYNQNDWARLLTIIQFRLNSSVNKVTEKTPFNIIYRYKSKMRMNIVFIIEDSSLLEKALAAKQEIELREKNKKTLKKLQEKV